MITPQIQILPFQDHYQAAVDKLMASIAAEFEETIFSPQSKTISEVSLLPGHRYWAACEGDRVLGTIGLCTLKNNDVELKRLFLHKDSRGKGIADKLLNTVISSARASHASAVYLGTMNQFKTAQAFYEKNGFLKIPESSLPDDFLRNPVDSFFYKKELL